MGKAFGDRRPEALKHMTRFELARIRKRLKLTQADLARDLRVSRAAVSRWESGKRPIDGVLALAMKGLAEGKRRRRRKHAEDRRK